MTRLCQHCSALSPSFVGHVMAARGSSEDSQTPSLLPTPHSLKCNAPVNPTHLQGQPHNGISTLRQLPELGLSIVHRRIGRGVMKSSLMDALEACTPTPLCDEHCLCSARVRQECDMKKLDAYTHIAGMHSGFLTLCTSPVVLQP